jgi:hypothetical protein
MEANCRVRSPDYSVLPTRRQAFPHARTRLKSRIPNMGDLRAELKVRRPPALNSLQRKHPDDFLALLRDIRRGPPLGPANTALRSRTARQLRSPRRPTPSTSCTRSLLRGSDVSHRALGHADQSRRFVAERTRYFEDRKERGLTQPSLDLREIGAIHVGQMRQFFLRDPRFRACRPNDIAEGLGRCGVERRRPLGATNGWLARASRHSPEIRSPVVYTPRFRNYKNRRRSTSRLVDEMAIPTLCQDPFERNPCGGGRRRRDRNLGSTVGTPSR